MENKQQLLDAWRGGDAVAGEALFEHYYDGIACFFKSKAGDDARDLIQRTFLILIENRSRLYEANGLGTFLFRIARNVLYDHYRRKRRSKGNFMPEEDSIEDLGATATHLILKSQEAKLLLNALRRIPLECQVIIELYFWEQMTAKEIADVLEIPEGTARTRIRRAKQLLEAQLATLASSPSLLHSTVTDLEGWAKQLRGTVKRRG